VLILNADDWGRDGDTTDRTLECFQHRSISSASAMVFMKDSERAAELAHSSNLDCGLHLNLTTEFSARGVPARLLEHQKALTRFLRGNRFAQVLYHPGLSQSFEYVTRAQRDEFCRIYGTEPRRVDGHHHMHLCTNVLAQKLLPAGITVRRSFSFAQGEKQFLNRAYRRVVNRQLARRHRITDFFFSLPPLDPPERLRKIFSLAKTFTVEVETHPVDLKEHAFLLSDQFLRLAGDTPVARCYALPNGKR